MEFIDNFLNKITMYRLVLYYLIGLTVITVWFGFLKIIPYSPVLILFSALIFLAVCWATNIVFSVVFSALTNVESVFISALILTMIVPPPKTFSDLTFIGWAAILAMASKYLLNIKHKHIFNPVAIAVVLTSFGFGKSATWWVGSISLMPFVVLGGLLIVRKLKKGKMINAFLLSAVLMVAASSYFQGGKVTDIITALNATFFHSSLFFFAFVMLTEPLTMPATDFFQIIYGALIGTLFAPEVHVASIYSTPELALIAGNLFAYLASPKERLILQLKEKIQTAPDMIDFIFPRPKNMSFVPGQYMEWTLPHEDADDRGNRRYFTLASSPTEDNIRVGIKFYRQGSSYKKSLASRDGQLVIAAGQRAGDFTLPDDASQKCVFMAGGIGITPFRSMIKYLLDKSEKRDIILMYANKCAPEIIYRDVFDQAENNLGIKTIYTLTDVDSIQPDWTGRRGRFDADSIKQLVGDYKNRVYYLSGPHEMVKGFEATIKNLGISKENIKTDFFPGFV